MLCDEWTIGNKYVAFLVACASLCHIPNVTTTKGDDGILKVDNIPVNFQAYCTMLVSNTS
jgi:hypothetical protein